MKTELINYEGALERLGGDKEFLAELLDEMVVQVETQFQVLKEAIENQDYEKINHLAHGLKGASANLDITRLFELFKNLEEQGRNKQISNGNEIVSQIEESTQELRTFIENL